MFLSDEGPTLETLNFTFHIGCTPTFLYFDLYLNTAYSAHYVCLWDNEAQPTTIVHGQQGLEAL